jgi:hypothetical protein
LVLLGFSALIGAGGCRKSYPKAPRPDGGTDVSSVPDAGRDADAGADSTAGDQRTFCPPNAAKGTKGKAESCACDAECQTGFCTDGVCCTSACNDKCKSCSLSSSLGDCGFIPAGVKPADPAICVVVLPTTCGQDGTCDGQGGCRKYVRGTECHAGTCDGDAISGALVCDGKGSCAPGASTLCVPYSCDPGISRCATTCTTNAQCAAGQQCVNKSCGKKMNGSTCSGDDDCTSGHCTDGVCCNVACAGGEPLALTDCLNFGNPEKPEIGWELAEAIEGIADTAEALGVPVVSGNVSLYNETDGRAIPPTPVVGCVGLVPDVRKTPSGWRPGDTVWLAEGDELELIGWLWRNASKLSLAHDVGAGDLAHALAEASAFSGHEFAANGDAPYGAVIMAGERPGWPHLRELGTVR